MWSGALWVIFKAEIEIMGVTDYQRGGALCLLNKVWCEKGHFAKSDKKRFVGGWQNQKKEPMCRHLVSQTPGLLYHIQV